MVDIPVVSVFESSLMVAESAGQCAGLVVIDAFQARFMTELVATYKAEHRIAGIVALDPPLTELEIDGGIDASELRARVLRASEKLIDQGADVIVPAEGVLNTILVDTETDTISGTPVVNGLASVLAHAEMLVRVRRVTNLRTSRTGALARPSEAMTTHFRLVTGEYLSRG